MAPRLDRREQNLLGVQVHCIISVGYGKRRVILVEGGAVFSKAVNGPSIRAIPKHVIAAQVAGKRLGVGDASRHGGVTGTVSVDGNAIANSSGIIGNGNGRRPRPLRRQLTRRRRAWVSAQLSRTKIFQSGCVIGRAVRSPSW